MREPYIPNARDAVVADGSRVYGDLDQPGPIAHGRGFARGPITHVVEMGMVGAIRCRIY